MKTSSTVKTILALALGVALLLGLMAAEPAKPVVERGAIEKVDATKSQFTMAHGKLKKPETFEWTAATRFVEDGKPLAASALKTGDRVTVSYEQRGKELVATQIVISRYGR
jgi:Cu/Ag efflux protein CusF